MRLAKLDSLLSLYTLLISFKFLLSIVAPSTCSFNCFNCKSMFSTSSKRTSGSHAAITSLDVRFKNKGKALGVFFGDLLGLWVFAGNASWGTRFGMWDGVAGISTSTLGVDCGGSLLKERVLNLEFNEPNEHPRIECPLILGECNVSG